MYLNVPRCSPTSNIITKENEVCGIIFFMVPKRVGLRVKGTEAGGAPGHLLPAFIFKPYGVVSDSSTSLQM